MASQGGEKTEESKELSPAKKAVLDHVVLLYKETMNSKQTVEGHAKFRAAVVAIETYIMRA